MHSSKKIETVLVEINETKLQTQIVLSESEQMIVNKQKRHDSKETAYISVGWFFYTIP